MPGEGGSGPKIGIVAPGGLEHYYEALARIAQASDVMQHLDSMEERFGIHMDWESVDILASRHGLRMGAS
jgi:hypothetical protein